jgi:WD40 repeat protein
MLMMRGGVALVSLLGVIFYVRNLYATISIMLFSGGGQLARRQHLLSRDGRLLLVCNANHVRVYSAITAELLFILEGHSDEVTSICLHPRIPAQVRSVSSHRLGWSF